MNKHFYSCSIKTLMSGLLVSCFLSMISSQSWAWEPEGATVRDPVREQVRYHTETRPAVERNRKETKSGVSNMRNLPTKQVDRNNFNSRSKGNKDDDDDGRTRNPHASSVPAEKFNDPWAPYRNYSAGEFGDVGDYETHTSAIQRAIAVADSCETCAKSSGSDDDAAVAARRAVINSIYSQSVKDEYDNRGVPEGRRNIPAGPLAAAAKYRHGQVPMEDEQGNIKRDDNGDPIYLNDQERAIDELILDGVVTYYNPGQVPIPQSTYEETTTTQKLGLQETLVLVAPGSIEFGTVLEASGVQSDLPPEEMFGLAMNAPIFPGGIVLMNNHFDPSSNRVIMVDGKEVVVPTIDSENELQVGGVVHEMSHAGEIALINLSNDYSNRGKDLPQNVREGSDTARALIGSPGSERLLVDVNEYLEDHEERVSVNDEYVNQWTEVMAYSNQYPDKERNVELVGRTLQEGMELDEATAQRVARDLVESETYKEIRRQLDEAADHFLEK